MKNCVIITTNFPPTGGIGVQRVTKFAKYLPDFGFNPIIVTIPAWSNRQKKDPSMLSELNPDLEIHRPFYFDYRKIIPGDIAKLFKSIERKYLFPDNFKLWCPFALNTIKKIAAVKKIDVVFITCKSFSLLHLVKPLKEMLGVPVIADFRDPFSFNYYNIDKPDKYKNRILELEEKAFNTASAITTVTPFIADEYNRIYPKSEIHLITNGFDPFDFPDINSVKKSSELKEFSLGYNGTFSKMVPLDTVAKVLCGIYDDLKISIKLNIATPMDITAVKKSLGGLMDRGLLNYHGFLPHKDSILKLYETNLLLMVLADDRKTEGVYSGKILEYLNIDRPVLLLNKKGSNLDDLITSTKKGVTVSISDEKEIRDAILRFYESWKNNSSFVSPDRNEIEKYNFRNLTEKLSQIMSNLLNKKESS
ncbi:MAG: glycosyltransferase [Candidatus Delongbacteria bacterium]|nr:glycosyltransferase [Candidatus Delongbacteria bacterium]MCG2761175.1 glycosyltransferase [Candidatus Delongbacteria bacterium]